MKTIDDLEIEDIKYNVQDDIDLIELENEDFDDNLDDLNNDLNNEIIETSEDNYGGAKIEESSEGFVKNVKLFFYGIPKKENPKYHCKKT